MSTRSLTLAVPASVPIRKPRIVTNDAESRTTDSATCTTTSALRPRRRRRRAETPCADSEAHGDLARARLSAAQEQPGDVRARHREHDDRQDGEEHDELPFPGPGVRPHFEERSNRGAAVAIELRIVVCERPRN